MADDIRLSGIVHRYGDRLALNDVTLTLPAGATIAVIGPDGAGKSCLLSLIGGTRRLQQGTIRVLGADMAASGQRDRIGQRIAFMPQGLGRNLYATLSVRENIDFHGELYGQDPAERRERIGRLLAATGLGPFVDRPAGRLSGGMRQKLSLCCALIHDPDLLILDEPTTGIDPLSRQQFWSFIDHLRSSRPGMTLIVATGYMEEAQRFDHIIALSEGRVLATGTPAEFMNGAPSMEAAFAAKVSGKPPTPFLLPPLPEADGPPVIRAEGLTRRFGDFTAVDHVSFAIRRGEIFGFLGSNGCGKSTTMKMLVGLLAASEGTAELFGRPADATDLEGRLRLGYMSQAFSLYEELTVAGNLALQAELYRIPAQARQARIDAALDQFGLAEVARAYPSSLPLGMRQRLQLAAACLHRPDILILDEPTSGVDPAAREMFWQTIVRLSRQDGITVFLSTHFMNEAARCDRISLMHMGKVLALDTPENIRRANGTASLEDAFIAYLKAADGNGEATQAALAPVMPRPRRTGWLRRTFAFARRESLELLRDPLRLAFSVIVPLFLMIVFAYGISFDVEGLPYGVLDQDHSQESRLLVQAFESSRYFAQQPPLKDNDAMMRRLRGGDISLAISIPPDFGKDMLAGRRPELGLIVDGTEPFRSETARGYALGVLSAYAADRLRQRYGILPPPVAANIEVRFRYNQDFRSIFAITPGLIMFLLAVIPAMMAGLGLVREREFGSIINLYASPAGVSEYLVGKQLPYVVLGFAALVCMILLAWLFFGVGVKGSLAMLLAGGLAYVFATTAFGVLMASLFRTQVAVMAASAVLTVIPAVNFSGFIYPASEIEGGGRLISAIFPGTWFQTISLGSFTKGLGFASLWPSILALALLGLAGMGAARLLTRKQEA
jgi:ribosome-dependent ATPase